MGTLAEIPGLGEISDQSGMEPMSASSDGRFEVGQNGVRSITATGDGKVEFIAFAEHTLAYVASAMGYSAYYPVHAVEIQKPVQGVLMDLDGTSVHSEEFWIWLIQLSTASLLDDASFELEEEDVPYVSGHSVSEHLQYCVDKYCPDKSVEEARKWYFEHMRREMDKIMKGEGNVEVFEPAPGLKEFLLELKRHDIRIGLVTSGLYEKAWPEIVSAFRRLGMGDPADFYDAIITAGYPLGEGQAGTLGELSPKPHPWLYAETARVGLGFDFSQRCSVVGIEDSGAGVSSIRLAGFPAVGISSGNLVSSGTRELCCSYCDTFEEIQRLIL